jgi:hypothetical protein
VPEPRIVAVGVGLVVLLAFIAAAIALRMIWWLREEGERAAERDYDRFSIPPAPAIEHYRQFDHGGSWQGSGRLFVVGTDLQREQARRDRRRRRRELLA